MIHSGPFNIKTNFTTNPEDITLNKAYEKLTNLNLNGLTIIIKYINEIRN